MLLLLLSVVLLVGQATTQRYIGEDEIISEMGSGEGSNGIQDPRLFKVIEKDSEGEFLAEAGWELVPDEDTLLYDQEFLQIFLDTPDMLEQFNNQDLAFIESNNANTT